MGCRQTATHPEELLLTNEALLALATRLSASSLQRRLSRRQSSDRHTERAARHIIQADLVAKHDRIRIATVLAADAALQPRFRRTALLHSHIHKLPHAARIERLERI